MLMLLSLTLMRLLQCGSLCSLTIDDLLIADYLNTADADATKPNADAALCVPSLMMTWQCCTLPHYHLPHHCILNSPTNCYAISDQIIYTVDQND